MRQDLDLDLVQHYLRTRRLGRTLHYVQSTTSTMDDARHAAEAGAPEGVLFFAEEQTAGRGTRGRAWASPAGLNLTFTLVLRPPVARLRRLSLVAPVAIANAVEQVTGLTPSIKWPNDLLLGGKKFAGILIEAEWRGGRPDYALVGIGLNVNFDPEYHRDIIHLPATSLALERGRALPREPIFAALLNAFEHAYRGATRPALYHGWRNRMETIGRRVTLSDGATLIAEGTVEDVEEDGALLVLHADGRIQRYHAGEVSLRPPAAGG